MTNKTIKTGVSLTKLIEDVIKETYRSKLEMNSAEERQRQQSLAEKDDDDDEDLFDAEGGDDEEPKDDAGKGKSSATVSDEMEKMKAGEVTTDDVVTKLNAIRAGKSFKDSAISGNLDEYVGSLTKAEKVALLAFLKGISQVVTGEIPPKDAVEPNDPAPDVTMKKGAGRDVVTVKPSIVKKPEGGAKRKSGEDTSGPVPIKPKK